MIPENYKTLIEKLKNKTAAKEAIWNKTSSDFEYKLNFEKAAITIGKWYDEENEQHYITLSIYNDSGDRIDNINAYSKNKLEYNALDELYITVNRIYYKVDETIESIFKEIEGDKTLGNVPKSNPLDDLPF